MSETLEALRRQIESVGKLGGVVRTMKTLAASNIGHYEAAVAGLAGYRGTLALALAACLRDQPALAPARAPAAGAAIGIVAFGSDQGLVGEFNERLAREILAAHGRQPGGCRVWAVGERLAAALEDDGLPCHARHAVPCGIDAVAPLIGKLLLALDAARSAGEVHEVQVFANEPGSSSGYRPWQQRLLPLDRAWRETMGATPWPGACLPEALGGAAPMLPRLLRQHLFVALYAACARSLAAENTSRLLAMQRAERNIDELLEQLARSFHRQRQNAIDDELFDVVAGFEALTRRARELTAADTPAA